MSDEQLSAWLDREIARTGECRTQLLIRLSLDVNLWERLRREAC